MLELSSRKRGDLRKTMSLFRILKWVFAIVAIFPNGCCTPITEGEALSISVVSNTTQTQNLEGGEIEQVNDFKLHYADFEEKTQLYIQSVRQGQLAMMSNSTRFLTELDRYMAKLPRGERALITIKSRLICDCEGKRMSPCPSSCSYSCFGLYEIGKAWRPENDCRNASFLQCQCYEGSSETCDNGVSSCFKETTGEISGDNVCSEYGVDGDKLVHSFLLVQDLLIEPINIFVRKVESRSSFMQLAADSIGHLANLTALACFDKTNHMCSVGAPGLLKEQINFFQQLKINVTYEMIENLDRIRNVYEEVFDLREQMLTHVNGLIKGYACCLRAANFTVEDIDCSIEPPNTDQTPPPLNKTRRRRTYTYGSYEWVPSNGSIPVNAVVAGIDGDDAKLYAGRAAHEGAILPAKVKDTAYVPSSGKEYKKLDFEVLVSKDISWKSTDSTTAIPAGALQVGHTKDGSPLYMGRAVHNGRKTPGKVQTTDGCLYVPFGFSEHKYCSYELMVLNEL